MGVRVLIGGAFAAVLLLLGAAVSLPVWAHPMNSDDAIVIAHAQPGLGSLAVTDVYFNVSLDGRVADRHGTIVYRRPGTSVRAGPVSLALQLPQAFWVVEMRNPSRPCSTATVVIDAGSRTVLAARRQSLPCRQL
jgi:hypothetical protein